MTDRLAEIKKAWSRSPTRFVAPESVDWLIAEVERLRNLERALMAQAEKHASDLKTALANKEIRP